MGEDNYWETEAIVAQARIAALEAELGTYKELRGIANEAADMRIDELTAEVAALRTLADEMRMWHEGTPRGKMPFGWSVEGWIARYDALAGEGRKETRDE